MHDPSDALREVDLLATSPVPFPALLEGSDKVELGGVQVRVASVEHLLVMKRASGRAQDLADIEALTRLFPPPTLDDHDGR